MNLGAGEILFIAVLALLLFGPQRLPEIARTVGRAVREFKRATSDLAEEIQAGLEDEPSHRTAESDGASEHWPPPGPRD